MLLGGALMWSKLDDGFADHPKVMAAGPAASWLYVCALTYANRLLTDGYIPATQVRKLADVDNAMALAERLVEVNLWERVDDGFQIHDFLDYNPSREKVLAERDAAAERMRKLRSGEVRANKHGTSGEVRLPRPVPSRPVNPDQEPDRESPPHTPLRGKRESGYTVEFLQFLDVYGPTDGPKKPAFAAWNKLTPDQRAAALNGLPKWHGSRKWRDGFKPYPQRYLNERIWEQEPATNGPPRASPASNGRPVAPTAEDIFEYAQKLRQEGR